MADLRGLRDGTELVPRLRHVIAEAPDAESRATIDRLIRIADALPASDEMVVTDLPDGSVVFTTDPLDPGVLGPGGPGPVDPGPVDPGPVNPGPVNPGSTDGATNTGTLPPPVGGLPSEAESFAIDVGIGVAMSYNLQDPAREGEAAARKAFEQFAASHSESGSGNGMSGSGFFTALGRIIGGAVGFILGGPGGAVVGAEMGARAGAVVDHALGDPHFDATTALACVICGPTCQICMVTAESGNAAPLQSQPLP